MQKESKILTWLVKNFDCNKQKIEDYDILKYRQDFIKQLKKRCNTKEEFSDKLYRDLRWQYSSRCEYELIIEITGDERVLLKPWVGCRDNERVAIDVTDDKAFNWRSFAREHIRQQIFKNEAKIDVYSQLTYGNQFEKLVDYCWHTRLKYERSNSKFDK